MVLAVIGAIGVVVIGFWLQDTATGALHTLGDELTATGRLTGLLGTYLLLVQIVLMARVAPLERLIGMDRLARWHSRNGQYVIGLLVAHAVAITAGYALGDHLALTTETSRVVLHYPDVLAATVSLGLLVGVAITSARAARRRMSYHAWYFVHLYTYLAVLLAFAHQLATGDDFATHPLHRIFWVALHLGTIGVLLGFRVVRPIRASLRHNLRVARITP
jgi:predicted ferric reductase